MQHKGHKIAVFLVFFVSTFVTFVVLNMDLA